MSNCPFCNLDPAPQPHDPTPRDGQTPGGLLRRAGRGLQWLFPASLLLLTPKCPMCVVAYVALFTGIGISATTARTIQILMPVLCVTALVGLAASHWRRRIKRTVH